MTHLTEQIAGLSLLAQETDDPGRSYWFVALMIIFAIQHLAERFKKKREAQDEEEFQRRAQEIDEEVFEEEPDGYHDPAPSGETLADFFRSLTQPQPVDEVPSPPVTLPPPRTAHATATKTASEARQARPTLTPEEQRALDKLKGNGPPDKLAHGRTRRQRMHSSSSHTALSQMLKNPESLRNAFILKEILEPPVASREESEPYGC
ncbi:MAG: hypothetical protein ACR2RV_12385 [Verrucomicrobiales bacterium]